MTPAEKMAHNQSLKLFKKQSRQFIMTSRFNEETWEQNKEFRKRHPEYGCAYGCPDPVSKDIPLDTILFVLEMNNDTNQIMGIGIIKNRPSIMGTHIYPNGNFNRYVYSSDQRIDREEMTDEEDQIMTVFDILCFTGNKHMKRGQGLKAFPADMLYRMSSIKDMVEFIRQMFKRRINKV